MQENKKKIKRIFEKIFLNFFYQIILSSNIGLETGPAY
jgi:hypothetical protein